MSLIDLIKVGEPMPQVVPNNEAHSIQTHVFVSEQIVSFDEPFYTYVPYCPNYINFCDLDCPDRNVISSRFTGCLMVIWQETYGSPIRIGHVDTTSGMSRKADWDNAKTQFRFAYEFKPSDFILPFPKGAERENCYGLYAIDQANNNIMAFSIVTGKKDKMSHCVIKKELVFTKPLL